MMAVDINVFIRVCKEYVAKRKSIVLFAFTCMILAAISQLLIVKLIKPMIDDIFVGKDISYLFLVSVSAFAVMTFKGLVNYGEEFFLDKLGQYIIRDMQFDAFARIVYLDMDFFNKNHTGDLVSKLTNDIAQVRLMIDETMINLGRNFFTVLLLVIYMFIQDFVLALVSFSVFPFAAFFVMKISKRIKDLAKKAQNELSRWTSFLSEALKGILLIKCTQSEKKEISKANVILDSIYTFNYKAIKAKTLVHPIMEGLSGIATCFCIFVGGLIVIKGGATVGVFMQFIATFAVCYKPAKSLAQANTAMQVGIVSASRVFGIIDLENKIKDKDEAVELHKIKGNIEFSSVSFKYPGTEEMVLNNVNFSINPNKTTVILGKSGVGKTTIINLLLRLYDPVSGSIKLDNYDIKDLTLSTIRRNVSLVSQNIILFNDTIKNNIRYGIDHVSDEMIFDAAVKANIDTFISGLENGYETLVGENGINFSGGQKQRIAIARAFLKESPILIFDEPTSALDVANTNYIKDAIQAFTGTKTIIIITHERDLFDYADKIIEFKSNGELVTKIIDNNVIKEED